MIRVLLKVELYAYGTRVYLEELMTLLQAFSLNLSRFLLLFLRLLLLDVSLLLLRIHLVLLHLFCSLLHHLHHPLLPPLTPVTQRRFMYPCLSRGVEVGMKRETRGATKDEEEEENKAKFLRRLHLRHFRSSLSSEREEKGA